METIIVQQRQQPINLKVVPFEFDFTPPPEKKTSSKKPKKIIVPEINIQRKPSIVPPPPIIECNKQQKKNVKELIEELLDELYSDQRDWSCTGTDYGHGSASVASVTSSHSNYFDHGDSIEITYLEDLKISELRQQVCQWETRLRVVGERLGRSVRVKDRLKRQQKRLCAAFSVLLRNITGDHSARFGVTPEGGTGDGEGEGGYTEWLHAMRLVARLPAGVPQHFRRKLWLTLSERHLKARGVQWPEAERACFRGTALPEDTELGAQILKDLHRTGCSLFCGAEGRENQAMLRRVLLAYARWNKDVGYCQGFNMLAAIILEVMEKSESDSLKVMIYLVEAVLPEGYFADDLRGLSADMAAFRDLLRLRLPRLARHMDYLQKMSDGGGVEPPLPDVFTMQWFLTLYATWLPRESLLRIWDLILLDGNEVLLLTALAIWDMLQDRILSARSADEYYSCMGGGAGAVYEAGDSLVARVVALGSAPELPRLRNLHRYRVAPPAPPIGPPNYHPPLHSAMRRGLRLFYSEDEGDSSDDGNKMALATVIPRREERLRAGDRLTLDIGALKRQYARLRERQRQAHVILAAACARHAAVGVPTSPTSLTVNNLLLGKSAIVSSRGRRLGPPPGSIPPSRHTSKDKTTHGSKHRPDTITWQEEKSRKTLSRRNSVKWKDIKKEKARKASIDLDETGDGIIVSETEANAMIASLRSRSSSETSSYSSHSESSSDTSLCDDNLKDSDSEPEMPKDDEKENDVFKVVNEKISPLPLTLSVKGTSNNSGTEIIPSYKSTSSLVSVESNSKDISEYMTTDAGEPLRSYIGVFESKLQDNVNPINSDDKTRFQLSSPNENVEAFIKDNKLYSDTISYEGDEILRRIGKPTIDSIFKASELKKQHHFPKGSINVTDLSPIDLSPCNFDLDQKSPHEYGMELNLRPTSSKLNLSSRPPDLIDSFTRYPNFVPDIDLSDKNISDVESPSRSPGAESIVVSEDEPPIPLKIDKYFEHSPDFFGARITVTDKINSDISSRRPPRRQMRIPKKPDSLTLQCNHNEKFDIKSDYERASSLPQSLSFSNKNEKCLEQIYIKENVFDENVFVVDSEKSERSVEMSDSVSSNDYVIRLGRKNSDRALQIIQENSKILSRILTKQIKTDTNNKSSPGIQNIEPNQSNFIPERIDDVIPEVDSPIQLRESTSDSLLGYKKRHQEGIEKIDFQKVRPVSVDDPISLEASSKRMNDVMSKIMKSPSTESLLNKTDLYGWENKGFLAKCDYKSLLNKPETSEYVYSSIETPEPIRRTDLTSIKKETTPEWRHSYSGESKTSVTLPSTEVKESPILNRPRISSTDYTFPLSNKYNDFVLSKASDICSRTVDQGPKVCENLLKTASEVSEFTHVVTSSISFTYEQSADDDSPIGAKSNSSDTLCQIASLDQVSTPISPKIFPRDTPTNPKDYTSKSERTKLESDDTCSAITSLIETDTLSSLSYPRSPSTGSYHPFPTRPAIRFPKELGVRLGMYPKDTISSPPK